MSAGVELDHVTVKFGNFTAVNDATLDIKGGEFFSFLGPSGCGKTTILRTVSGFLDPTGGRVRIGGQDMEGIGPNKRPTALIFQNLALFPLMTVADNIAYGLRVRGMSKAERMKKADELLHMFELPGQGQVLSIMYGLVTRRGLGLFLISNDLNLVSRFCDRVLVMDAGRVVEEIRPRDLHAAQHPYTRGLMACLPSIDGPQEPLPVLDRQAAWAED